MLKTKLLFGVHPIIILGILENREGVKEVILSCKGVTGTSTQIDDFVNKKKGRNADYFFGRSKVIERASRVEIDCIKDGEMHQVQAIHNYCQEFLSENIISEEIAQDIINTYMEQTDTLGDLVKHLDNKLKSKSQLYNINYDIVGFENEVLICLNSAVVKYFHGENLLETQQGASGNVYPDLYKIKMSNGETITVPMGKMKLPGFSKDAFIDTRYSQDYFKVFVKGQIQKKFENVIDDIVTSTQKLINEESIYKNKLLSIKFNDDSDFPTAEPEIIDTSLLNRQKPLILSTSVKTGILNIVGRLKYPEECENDGVDVKSTFLLSGIGGTGKTETMFREIAPIALAEGYTILYCQDSKSYHKLLKLADTFYKRGWKILIIIEDIDQAFDGEVRDDLQQEILNTLDAGFNKEVKLVSLLTTNYKERLSSFFIRRVTDIIIFEGMDYESAKEFIDIYVHKKYLSINDDNRNSFEKVYHSFDGIVPSLAKRIIDKVLVIRRARGIDYVDPQDILLSIENFKTQQELSTSKGYVGEDDSFAGAFKKIMSFSGMSKDNLQLILSNTYRGNDETIN